MSDGNQTFYKTNILNVVDSFYRIVILVQISKNFSINQNAYIGCEKEQRGKETACIRSGLMVSQPKLKRWFL